MAITIDDILNPAPKPSADTVKAQIRAFLLLCETLREAIEASKTGIPSGHLYAMVMAHGVTLPVYEKAIGILVESGRITDTDHLLRAA